MTNKVKPKNPNTASQQTVRANLRAYAAMWATLGKDVIAQWNAAAGNAISKNKIGTSHTFTGFNLFVAENQRMQAVAPGNSPVTVPPVYVEPIRNGNIANLVVVGGSSPSMICDIPLISTGNSLILHATSPLSQGKNFVKGKFRQIAVLPAHAAQSALSIESYYAAVFGAPLTSKNVWVRAEIVNLVGSKWDKVWAGPEIVATAT